MTEHNFRVGDRVIYVGNNPAYADKLATVNDVCGIYTHVQFDHEHLNSYRCIFSRIIPKPVEIGDWVRIIGPDAEIVEKYANERFEVVAKTPTTIGIDTSTAKDQTAHWCKNWSPQNLRVVKNMSPSKGFGVHVDLNTDHVFMETDAGRVSIKNETWTATNQLRWNSAGQLEQLHTSDKGNAEWQLVPSVEPFKPHDFKRGDRVEYVGADETIRKGTRGRVIDAIDESSVEVMFYAASVVFKTCHIDNIKHAE